LAAYLRYPQIEGSGDELVPEGTRVQLMRNKKSTDPKASRPPMLEGKRFSSEVMQAKELDMLIIHMEMELNLDKTLCHFLVAQLQDLEPNVSRKH
jgi:hypothetical protein